MNNSADERQIRKDQSSIRCSGRLSESPGNAQEGGEEKVLLKKRRMCKGALLGESSLNPERATSRMVAIGHETKDAAPSWPLKAALKVLLLVFSTSKR